jgi:hypothetical protein
MLGIAALGLIAFLAGIAALIAPFLDRHPHIPPWHTALDTALDTAPEDAQEGSGTHLRTVHTGADQ